MPVIALAMAAIMFGAAVALGGCQRAGTSLTCSGETFKIDFGDKAATVMLPDNTSANLPKLEQPQAAGAATVYSNGRMTFTRLETAGLPPLVKFARGKMAFQECVASGG
jgi:hypothetical protein